jgi:hypothetical protein
MFPLDFPRSSELESLLRAGIGFHLRHKALKLILPGHSGGGAKVMVEFGFAKKIVT